MGRPREHDEETRRALLAAAERLVRERGADAVTVRAVAAEVGTSTRAVYSVLGSKDGLLVALATHAFALLAAAVERLPETDDPVDDVVAVTFDGYRRWALANPNLYRLAFAQIAGGERPVQQAAAKAMTLLRDRVQRAHESGLVGGRDVAELALTVHSLCEGLVEVELRGTLARLVPGADPARVWRQAMTALMTGSGPEGCDSPGS